MIARPQSPNPPKADSSAALRPGANVLMGRNPLGFWMGGPGGGGADFRHPFTVYVVGGRVRVSRGLVLANIAMEPEIGNAPIGGDATHAQPSLKLDVSLVDDLNQSWVCVEVTPDADGKLDVKGKTSKVVAVQRDHPIAMTGPTGRAPLAMLLRKAGGWQVLQIAMFHFRYETVQPANGPRRHFFL